MKLLVNAFQEFRKFSKKIADVQTFIILTLVYILIVPFVTVLFQVFKKTSLSTSWDPWKQHFDTTLDLEKQF